MGQDGFDYEVWELAIQRELEAYYFYMALAELVDDDILKDILRELANEELGHKAKLELEVLKAGQTIPINEETPESLLDSYMASNLEMLRNMDYKDILLLAIQKEESSFRTYISLIPVVRDQQSRETLMAIAQEEVKHKHRFEIEYDLLMKKKL